MKYLVNIFVVVTVEWRRLHRLICTRLHAITSSVNNYVSYAYVTYFYWQFFTAEIDGINFRHVCTAKQIRKTYSVDSSRAKRKTGIVGNNLTYTFCTSFLRDTLERYVKPVNVTELRVHLVLTKTESFFKTTTFALVVFKVEVKSIE